MINDADGLSRSASQHDQSDQSSACLRNQSNCSSLTSGIGQSDQSICNDSKTDPSNSVSDAERNQHNSSNPNGLQLSYSKTPSVPSVIQEKFIEASNKADKNEKIGISKVPPKESKGTDNQAAQITKSKEEEEEETQRLKSEIKNFVDIIFTDSQSISLEEKAEFGKLMRTPQARLLFAIYVDDYRVNSKRVNEFTFYSLAQYFSIVLLECLLAEDFRPAKIIMNMMFTYYYEQVYDKIPPRDRPSLKEETIHRGIDSDEQTLDSKTIRTYLYTLLRDQEIFKSIRFWTSAFYESVIIERNNHPVFIDRGQGKLSNERRNEELDCSKNITFGLLGSFIHNMCLLELSHEFCQEFLDKHSTIAGLSDEQLDMLRSNLKAMFNDSSGEESMSQATASEKLTSFLHKLGSKLNQAGSLQQEQQ